MTVTEHTTVTDLPAAGTYGIDASHSHVGFKVRHLMVSKVRGRFTDFDAALTIADEPLQSSIEVTVQLESVDTRDEQRDAHLKGADFFQTEANKTMTFTSTGVKELGRGRYEVTGDLTLLGVTKPLVLDVAYDGAATDPWGNSRIGISATGELNREDFGLNWNQALETGGVLVGKKVEIEIEAEFIKQ